MQRDTDRAHFSSFQFLNLCNTLALTVPSRLRAWIGPFITTWYRLILRKEDQYLDLLLTAVNSEVGFCLSPVVTVVHLNGQHTFVVMQFSYSIRHTITWTFIDLMQFAVSLYSQSDPLGCPVSSCKP